MFYTHAIKKKQPVRKQESYWALNGITPNLPIVHSANDALIVCWPLFCLWRSVK